MQHPTNHLLKAQSYLNIFAPGRRFGVTDLGAEVVTFVSHATQQRLQSLLEKVSHVAQQKNINFKVRLQRLYRGIIDHCFLSDKSHWCYDMRRWTTNTTKCKCTYF